MVEASATSAERTLDDQFDEAGRHPGTIAASGSGMDQPPDGYIAPAPAQTTTEPQRHHPRCSGRNSAG